MNLYRLCGNELILIDLSEEATKKIAQKKNPKGLKENLEIANKGGTIVKNARTDLEKELGESVITSNNNLNYQYIDDNNKKAIDNK